MDPSEYGRQYDAEDTYWWYQGRLEIVERLLDMIPGYKRDGLRVLDLGCGTGLLLRRLEISHHPVGIDFSPLALEFSRRRGAERLARGDVQALPIVDASFDVVTALDLAEHIERDDALFAETLRVLRPGGHLVVSVPAYPFLWSEHDETLYHHRRYRRGELRRHIEEAGFDVVRCSYCITFTFPLIVGFRLLQRLKSKKDRPKTHLVVLPRWANALLRKTVSLEALLLRWINLPFGVTLVALARKSR
ncbi:class I SAM-dependent methyltransferase [Candidatus Sumerlaeota bacterium]|nr:class I SAM-dependent methyltransferase [Candidatus Sumerlaeota bacterium]